MNILRLETLGEGNYNFDLNNLKDNDIEFMRKKLLGKVVKILLRGEVIYSHKSKVPYLFFEVNKMNRFTNGKININLVCDLIGTSNMLGLLQKHKASSIGILSDHVVNTITYEEIQLYDYVANKERHNYEMMLLFYKLTRKFNDFKIFRNFLKNNLAYNLYRDPEVEEIKLTEDEMNMVITDMLCNVNYKHYFASYLKALKCRNFKVLNDYLIKNPNYIDNIYKTQLQLLVELDDEVGATIIKNSTKSFILKTSFNLKLLDLYSKVFDIEMYKSLTDIEKVYVRSFLNMKFGSSGDQKKNEKIIDELLRIVRESEYDDLQDIKNVITFVCSLVSANGSFYIKEYKSRKFQGLLSDTRMTNLCNIISEYIVKHGSKACLRNVINHGLVCLEPNTDLNVKEIMINKFNETDAKRVKLLLMEASLKN